MDLSCLLERTHCSRHGFQEMALIRSDNQHTVQMNFEEGSHYLSLTFELFSSRPVY